MTRSAHPPVRRKWAIGLLVTGCLFVVVTFLAAFTIFGEIAAVMGLSCIAGGAVLLGRSNSS